MIPRLSYGIFVTLCLLVTLFLLQKGDGSSTVRPAQAQTDTAQNVPLQVRLSQADPQADGPISPIITPTVTTAPATPVSPLPTPTFTQTPVPTKTPTKTPVPPVPTCTPTSSLQVAEPAVDPPVAEPPCKPPVTGPAYLQLERSAAASTQAQASPVKTIGEQALQPDRLWIPSIQTDIAVQAVGWFKAVDAQGRVSNEWEVADSAAGWHRNSALPGDIGNVVLSGHNSIKGSVFKSLDKLKKGDPIYIWRGNKRYTYLAEDVQILPEEAASEAQRAKNLAYLQPTDDSRLTLISCWPAFSNSHRVFVVARLDPYSTFIEQNKK